MGRAHRIEFPGAFYHVMSRGNGDQELYRKHKDFTAFIDCLGEACERYGLCVHTYCLMTNHYHFVAETPHGNLSAAMHWINFTYAKGFNRRHDQRGHLFQRRYKALIVDADAYLNWLSRYIHLNPVRARMVTEPAAYRWSSYRSFIGKARSPQWLQTGFVLRQFGKTRGMARPAYRRFVEGAQERTMDVRIARSLREGAALVRDSFLDGIESSLDQKKLPGRRRPPPLLEIDAVLEAVSASFQVPVEFLIEKGRKGNLARDLAIYLTRRRCGLSTSEIGARFGDISPNAISMRCRAIRELLRKNTDLQAHLSEIEGRFVPPPDKVE